MLKKVINYTDLDGEEASDTVYFHLTEADLMELNLSEDGGFEDHLKELIKARSAGKILAEVKKLILMSYGIRDGKRFVRTDALREEFQQTEAFSALYMELATDANAAADFVNGIVPKKMAETMAKLKANENDKVKNGEDNTSPDEPKYMQEKRQPSKYELQNMSHEELAQAYRYTESLRSVSNNAEIT